MGITDTMNPGGNEGNSCIISAIPISKEGEVRGILLVYYNTINFENMITQMQSDMFDLSRGTIPAISLGTSLM